MRKGLIFLVLLSISFLTILVTTLSIKQQYVIASIFIPPSNESEIYSLAYEVSNPSSGLYHHFLNSSQIENLVYSPKEEEIVSYLSSHGIKIIGKALNIIVINATITQLEEFLNTSVGFYQFENYTYYQGIGTYHGSLILASNFSVIALNKPNDLVTPSLISSMEKKALSLNFTYADEFYPVTWLIKAYNASVLNATGKGYTIGILDFYGDPTILQQLAYFDKLYHIPPPPSFEIEYIGQPCPFGGIITGWNLEISLDVEVSHAVAPGANIILYVANPNLPLPYILAKIVQEDKVNVLSQSWGIPESEIVDNPSNLEMIYEANFYYALGSLEGITFLASSGDVGGSGYSTSPIGSVAFPSTSPFVTAIGGTTIYIDLNESSYQTAWSNYGFIPYFINYGGSTGGISVLFVKPWYQENISTPTSYPNGRMVPDISLNANVFPGIYVVFPSNVTYPTGGTSEASPLFAGFLTLIMQKDNMTFGLINPLLYYLGEKYYNEAYFPITFGYNIPWVAKYGYNLVTGLGAPNIGNIAYLVKKVKTTNLVTEVSLYNSTNSTFYFLPYEEMKIVANITYNGKEVSNGTFYANIYTLKGEIVRIKLTYNGSLWIGNYIIPPNVEGPIEVQVANGFADAFVGYIFVLGKGGIFPINAVIKGKVYTLYGNIVNSSSVEVNLYEYNPLNNSYEEVANLTLMYSDGEYIGVVPHNLTAGPLLVVGNNVYSYISTFVGSSLLLNTLIIPPLVVEPGVVTPGESLFIEPTNLPLGNINISAELYYGNTLVSYTNLSWDLIPFEGLLVYVYVGYLKIPNNAHQGLYTIILNEYSEFGNSSLLVGRYYSQIYVVPSNLSIKAKIEGLIAEGENVKIIANITYPNGSEVKFGMFSATVYPLQLQSQYESLTESLEIPLWFNGTEWIGNFTLPSTYTQGNLTYLSGNYYGPFGVFISGISANGYPTTNNLNAQQEFIVKPYTLIENELLTSNFQPFYSLFENDTITDFSGNLQDDIFLGINSIENSEVTIEGSEINGTLIIKNSNVTLNDVIAEKIIAINSSLHIYSSKIQNLTIVRSTVYNTTSDISYLSIPLPIISFNGNSVIVNGTDISSVQVYVNGKLYYQGDNTVINLELNSGYNSILVKVKQTDGEIATKTFNVYIPTQQSNTLSIIAIVISLIAIILYISGRIFKKS